MFNNLQNASVSEEVECSLCTQGNHFHGTVVFKCMVLFNLELVNENKWRDFFVLLDSFLPYSQRFGLN